MLFRSIPHVRSMLQNTGVFARERWGNAFWINQVFRHMDKTCRDENDNLKDVVIADVRFKNEANAIDGWRNGTVVRINRPDVQPVNQHISEVDLDGYVFKHIIDNDSDLFDLHLKVEDLMRTLGADKK